MLLNKYVKPSKMLLCFVYQKNLSQFQNQIFKIFNNTVFGMPICTPLHPTNFGSELVHI